MAFKTLLILVGLTVIAVVYGAYFEDEVEQELDTTDLLTYEDFEDHFNMEKRGMKIGRKFSELYLYRSNYLYYAFIVLLQLAQKRWGGDLRTTEWLFKSYTLEINQHYILRFFLKLKWTIWSTSDDFIKTSRFKIIIGHSIIWVLFFLIKSKNGECNVRNYRRFLFGVSSDVHASKSAF